MSRLGWLLLALLALTCVWRGSIQVRLAKECVALRATAAVQGELITVQNERILSLEESLIEAGALMMGARAYSDDLVTRAQQTARATGVPMWDFACAERGAE